MVMTVEGDVSNPHLPIVKRVRDDSHTNTPAVIFL